MNRLFLLIAITMTLAKSYFLGPEPLEQLEGEAYCNLRGSNLASIHSEEDFDDASALCDKTDKIWIHGKKMCFIGLQLEGNKWKWSDGTPTNYGFDTETGDPKTGEPWLKGAYSFNGKDGGLSDSWFDAKCQTLDIEKTDEGLDDIDCDSAVRPICNGDCDEERFLKPCNGGCPGSMICCPQFQLCHCNGMTPEQVEEAYLKFEI